jgi:hypothetical protein
VVVLEQNQVELAVAVVEQEVLYRLPQLLYQHKVTESQ